MKCLFKKEKKSIRPYDDKRYKLKDGIKTLPHCDPFSNTLYEMVDEVLTKPFGSG